MAWHSDYRCARELQMRVLWCCLHFNAHPSLIQVLQHRYFGCFAVLLGLSFNGHTIAALFTNLLNCLWLARLKAWQALSARECRVGPTVSVIRVGGGSHGCFAFAISSAASRMFIYRLPEKARHITRS